MWSRTPCTSKFPADGTHIRPPSFTVHLRLYLQQHPEEGQASRYVLWVSVSFCGDVGAAPPEHGSDSFAPFPHSVFGVVLILVDFVLVIVDISLYDRSREVGDALEAVSLLISLFFLADVLLRVFVDG